MTLRNPVPLGEEQARRALAALEAHGWEVGPPVEPEAWRRQVRAEARRRGLRLRTGVASVNDSEPRPCAATVDTYEAMRTALGALELAAFGVSLVLAQEDAKTRSGPEPKPGA